MKVRKALLIAAVDKRLNRFTNCIAIEILRQRVREDRGTRFCAVFDKNRYASIPITLSLFIHKVVLERVILASTAVDAGFQQRLAGAYRVIVIKLDQQS